MLMALKTDQRSGYQIDWPVLQEEHTLLTARHDDCAAAEEKVPQLSRLSQPSPGGKAK